MVVVLVLDELKESRLDLVEPCPRTLFLQLQ